MTAVISVENLSKVYRLGQIGTGTFSYDLKLWWARLRGKPNPLLKIGETDYGNRAGEDLWALKDVSFTVEQGEVLGIIGRNGAGKSTLLKILSRVTAPTSGKVKIKGRVASLLEVGTGFHPELTGRENIYLNGAILGMTRDEIARKFDEIVAFAEVEKFIDTPVKRYSSGMYVRLAFAVAAHLEPEILVVDEVLAVGDAAFQKKCLGKMGDIADEGRTVLFVSHNMRAVKKICDSALYLKCGNTDSIGPADNICNQYIRETSQMGYAVDNQISCRLKISHPGQDEFKEWGMGEDILLQITISHDYPIPQPAIDLAFYTAFGQKLFSVQSDVMGSGVISDNLTKFVTEFTIRNTGIAVDQLFLDVGVRSRNSKTYLGLFRQIEIIPISFARLPAYCRTDGIICLPVNFKLLENAE